MLLCIFIYSIFIYHDKVSQSMKSVIRMQTHVHDGGVKNVGLQVSVGKCMAKSLSSEETLAEERTSMPQMLIGEWQQDALGTIWHWQTNVQLQQMCLLCLSCRPPRQHAKGKPCCAPLKESLRKAVYGSLMLFDAALHIFVLIALKWWV